MNPFDKYPYSDMHELNLDWILKKMKEALEQVASGEATIQEALTTVQQYNTRLQQVETKTTQLDDDIVTVREALEAEITAVGQKLALLENDVKKNDADIKRITPLLDSALESISILQQAVENMAVTRHLEYREGHFIENDTIIRDFEDLTEYILRGYEIDVRLTDGTHLRLADYIPTRITFNGVVTDTVSPYVYTLTINVSDNITEKTIPIAPDMTIYYYPSSDPEGHPEWEYMIYEGTRVNNAEAIAISSRNPDIVILDTSSGYIYHQSTRISFDAYVFINPLENGVGIFTLGASYIDVSYNNFASVAQVLTKQNTTPFTPTEDYQPATKKYVDEHGGGGIVYNLPSRIESGTPSVMGYVGDTNIDTYTNYFWHSVYGGGSFHGAVVSWGNSDTFYGFGNYGRQACFVKTGAQNTVRYTEGGTEGNSYYYPLTFYDENNIDVSSRIQVIKEQENWDIVRAETEVKSGHFYIALVVDTSDTIEITNADIILESLSPKESKPWPCKYVMFKATSDTVTFTGMADKTIVMNEVIFNIL